MPRTAAPKKSSLKNANVEPILNGDGLITNWSATWKDAKDLKVLVEKGLLEGKKPAKVRDEYTQFKKYHYKPFSSALNNIRSSLNKQLEERDSHVARGSTYEGLRSHLPGIDEEDLLDEEDEEEDYDDLGDLGDGVSQLSIDEFSNMDGGESAFKSVRFKMGGKSPSASKKKAFGRTKLSLPYVMDVWKDEKLRKRISIQIQLPSGVDIQKHVSYRVSTAKNEFVVSVPLNSFMTSPEGAFYSHLLNGEKNPEKVEVMKMVLSHHPKTIARRDAISKLSGRNPNASISEDHRIPLPFVVQHRFISEEEDELFFGDRVFLYLDHSKHLHVELVAEQNDGYIPIGSDDKSVKLHSTTPVAMPRNSTDIPDNISVASGTSKKYKTGAEGTKNGWDDDESMVESCTPCGSSPKVYDSNGNTHGDEEGDGKGTKRSSD